MSPPPIAPPPSGNEQAASFPSSVPSGRASPPGSYPPPPIASGSQPPGYAVTPEHGLFAQPPGAVPSADMDLRGGVSAFVAAHRIPVLVGAALLLIIVFALGARGCSDDPKPAGAPPDGGDSIVEPDAAVEAAPPIDAGKAPTPPRKQPANER
jgi:hypothetical protein